MGRSIERTFAVARPSSSGRHPPSFVEAAAIGIDVASIAVTGLLSGVIYASLMDTPVASSGYFGAAILVACIFATLMRAGGRYELTDLLSVDRQLKWVAICWFLSVALTGLLAFLMKASADLSRGAGIVFAAAGLCVLIAQRVAWRFGLAKALASGSIRTRKIVFLTTQSQPVSLLQMSTLRQGGMHVAKHVCLPTGEVSGERDNLLGRVVANVRGSDIEEIVVALSAEHMHLLDPIIEGLGALPLPVRLLPDGVVARVAMQPVRCFDRFALVDIKRQPLSAVELASKRALDVAIAIVALLVLCPLLLAAMLAIKLDTAGPVIFRQTRRGYNGRAFTILKLRTMRVMENGAVVTQAKRGDARVTRVGSWLRRTSIDELPQLWNVLRGDMSIVGPRPHAVAHDNHYDALIENYAWRQHVKPGLTGWAQVSGHRGETPDVSAMAARVDHDIRYISNWSLLLDLRILVLTAIRLFGRAAY